MGTIVRAAAAYVFLLFIVRVMGRRDTSAMTVFELVSMFLVAGVMLQSVVLDDRSLVNAFLAAATIGAMHVTIAYWKQRAPRFGAIVDGTPIVILEHGRIHPDRMNKLHIQEQDVMAAARMRGYERFDQIAYAVVERNGTITIVDDAEAAETNASA